MHAGAPGLWAASRRLIWPLPAGAARLGLCAGSCAVCLADPARGATSGLWATRGRWGEVLWVLVTLHPLLRAPGGGWDDPPPP